MNRKTKWCHRLLALAMAAMMCCTYFPIGAFAETPPLQESTVVAEEQQTDETETDSGQTDASSPDPGVDTEEASEEFPAEDAESMIEPPAQKVAQEPAEKNEPYTFDGEILYADMPDTPTGSYIGSYGLPVATGETKIGLSAWDADLVQGSYLSVESLDSDNLTLAAPLLEDTDYAIVPILAQVEYPAEGSTLDLVLPDSVTLLDYYGEPAEDAESILHGEYSETSAAVLGVYVQADADFTAQLVYTAPDGSTLKKTLNVTIDRNAAAEYPFPDSEIAAFAERPTPAVTSGKITKVAKVNGTWLIWFNGEPAYCCTHGANGQPAGCPTYTYVNTSTVNADQCIPGDHYGNQIRIWGGLNQLSLGDADDLPAVFSADEGEETSLLDFCTSIYDDVQMYIIENFPESTAAEIYLASADELLNGVEAYASARGYYTYIYNPGREGYLVVETTTPKDLYQTYGNKPYPIAAVENTKQIEKAIDVMREISPIPVLPKNEVEGCCYDAERQELVFCAAIPPQELLQRLPAEIVMATAESSYAGISENELLRQTAAAISVEVCGRLGLPMPPDAFQTLEGMRDHIPDGEERRTLEKVREMAVTFGDAVCKRLKLERGQPAPQQEER